MLKKIVKYGNSSALVLDKALLELLNMAEGSIVKIKTDGISLIITPQNALVQEIVSPTLTIEDTFNDAHHKALELSFGDPEKVRAYQTGCKEITDRYMAITKNKMDTPEIRQALEALQKRFAKDEGNPEYTEQIRKVYQKYVPELERMYQELDTLVQELVSQDGDTTNRDGATSEFAKVHVKYAHMGEAVAALNEDPEYVHEMALLAEKYQTKNATNPQEYFEEYTKLISKHLPEYAAYAEEVKKVAEQFNQTARK